MITNYLDKEGLDYFLSKILEVCVTEEQTITNDEIDEICGSTIQYASEVKF